MGGAIKAVGNVVNQISNVVNQVANVLRQGINLLQGIQSGLNSISQAFQGNQQDNQRADSAVQRAVDDRALDQMRTQRAARLRA
ncbi:hypothetical protein D3C72_1887860 [compost metagenome]